MCTKSVIVLIYFLVLCPNMIYKIQITLKFLDEIKKLKVANSQRKCKFDRNGLHQTNLY